MNIRYPRDVLHPDLSLAGDCNRIARLFHRLWGVRYSGYAGPRPSPLADDVKGISANDAFRDLCQPCPVGLVICTWNRPLYLEQCLDSVRRCDLGAVVTVLVDDASGDADALKLIDEFELDSPLIKIHKKQRRQIHHSLDLGWCLLNRIGCRYLSNLDGDAIVAPSWLDALQSLHRRLGDPARTILSPFNKSGDPSVIDQAEDYVVKRELGGLCWFFQAGLLSSIRPLLFDKAWDNLASAHFADLYAEGYRLICTRPSYVQHIGAVGMNSGPHRQFDQAADFVGLDSPRAAVGP